MPMYVRINLQPLQLIYNTTLTLHRYTMMADTMDAMLKDPKKICLHKPCGLLMWGRRPDTLLLLKSWHYDTSSDLPQGTKKKVFASSYYTLSFTMVVLSCLLLHSNTMVSLCTGFEDPSPWSSKQDLTDLHLLILTLLIIFPSGFFKIIDRCYHLLLFLFFLFLFWCCCFNRVITTAQEIFGIRTFGLS